MGNHEAAGGYPQNAGVLVVLVDLGFFYNHKNVGERIWVGMFACGDVKFGLHDVYMSTDLTHYALVLMLYDNTGYKYGSTLA